MGDYCSVTEDAKVARAKALLGEPLSDLEKNAVEALDLMGCGGGDEGAVLLGAALRRNSSLRQINLRWNAIGATGAEALARALEENNRSLCSLDLFCNSIKDAGATALARALRVNGALQVLDLGWNSIGNTGACALAAALKANQALTRLGLEQNAVAGPGAEAIADALRQNTTLTSLQLARNPVGEAGALVLAEGASCNPCLKQFDLLPELTARGSVTMRSNLSLSAFSIPEEEDLREELNMPQPPAAAVAVALAS